jgi:hypothetical protein
MCLVVRLPSWVGAVRYQDISEQWSALNVVIQLNLA